MLFKNDLYDISAAFVNIRSEPNNVLNAEIALKLFEVISDPEPPKDENGVRLALSTIEGLDKSRWYFVFHSNYYVNHSLLKDKNIYLMLIDILDELQNAVSNNNSIQTCDLMDAVHGLPQAIADNYFKVPSKYWKTYIRPYRKKWNETFLVGHEKTCK